MSIISNFPSGTGLPSGGNTGQVLTIDEYGKVLWVDVPDNLQTVLSELLDEKQDKLTGTNGQIVGIGQDGIAQAMDHTAQKISYDNTTSALSANNIQEALDQIYQTIQQLKFIHVGSSAPVDTSILWIDTTASTGGLKYHNGTAWTHVPVAYT